MTTKQKLEELKNNNESKDVLIVEDDMLVACHKADYLVSVADDRSWGSKKVSETIVREKDVVVKVIA